MSPSASLAVLIFNFSMSPFVDQNNLAWTAAFMLVSLVVLTNLLARWIARKRLKAS
jgi:phosphate transport system permease protein